MQKTCIYRNALGQSALAHGALMIFVLLLFSIKRTHFIEVPIDLIMNEIGKLKDIRTKPAQKHYTFQNAGPHLKQEHKEDADETETESETGSAASTLTSPAPSGNELQTYMAKVFEILQNRKKYPKSSVLNEEEGVVEIEIEIHRNGNVLGQKILTPSPFKSLDEAALESVRSVQVFPALPAQIQSESIKLHIPIRFRLKD